MQKNLVIVESPAKAKTIEKFLGKEFKVLSSYGHIRDLQKKGLGIDIENDFNPIYEIPADKKKLVDDLKKEAATASMVWLASDEDREGEAIAWHLHEVLNLNKDNTKRIVFHEITKTAILEAIENPRFIDYNLVNAQQARRVLDRIVGFELSPVLWKKIKPALSAGRVQSVAVRLIVERERDIKSFTSESSYRIVASFLLPGTAQGEFVEVKAELNKRPKVKEEAIEILNGCNTASFSIEDLVTKPGKRSPAPPFTTSTLQQEAARKLGYSVSQTMMIAQRLYESGKITYMRTDSVNLSGFAIHSAQEVITETMGKEYSQPRNYQTKTKGAQEAHEAIRPTNLSTPHIEGNAQEKNLYQLIWKRAVASQMSEAQFEKTTATIAISTRDEHFTATGEVIKFDGFLKLYIESVDEDGEDEKSDSNLPPMHIGEVLKMDQIAATERFSQAPPRYSEASLVRKMEELGIGRPSTYAPTISTIQQREYVEKGEREGEKRSFNQITLKAGKIKEKEQTETTGSEKGKLVPTDIGMVVNDYLLESFPKVLNYNFTAKAEKDFDSIAEGEIKWQECIHNFYEVFHKSVTEAIAVKTEHKVGERMLGIDPKSGRPVSIKIGRFGVVAQIGAGTDEEKPQFASINKDQSIETITLEEALELFKLPRQVGSYEEKDVTVGVGRFGPYIRHNNAFVSIPKDIDPLEITLDESIKLIDLKRLKEKEKQIKVFAEDAELEICNGRFGPYIIYKGENYKIPKGSNAPALLTFEECKQIIEEAGTKAAKPAKTTKGSKGTKGVKATKATKATKAAK